jgi:5-methylcytosine-specific restriction endonuclease McrA
VLFEEPICATEGCGRLAEEVDHITPLSQGGAEVARENLRGLCRDCHAKKSGQESIDARTGGSGAAA